MPIAESIISMFLQHQFAKERQQQQIQAQQEAQQKAQQAQQQQMLMMKDVVGQQQEQRLQEQIAARKDALQAQLQQHKADQEQRSQQFDQGLKFRQNMFQEGIKKAELLGKQHLDAYKLEKDYSIKQQGQEYDRRFQEQQAARKEAELSKPALPGTYLDPETGTVVPTPTTRGEAQDQSLRYLKQGSVQERAFTATNLLSNHLALTLYRVNNLIKKNQIGNDRNRFSAFANTALNKFKNDPDVISLTQLLSPASAYAIAQAYSSTGSRSQAGVRLAQLFSGALYSEGDSTKSVLAKLHDMGTLAKQIVSDEGLPSGKIDEVLSPINSLIQLSTPQQPQQ